MVKVYALSTCPYCKMARKFLDDSGVDYEVTEVDLLKGSQLEAVKAEVKRISGGLSFPVIVIDGRKEAIVGFDKKNLQQALGL